MFNLLSYTQWGILTCQVVNRCYIWGACCFTWWYRHLTSLSIRVWSPTSALHMRRVQVHPVLHGYLHVSRCLFECVDVLCNGLPSCPGWTPALCSMQPEKGGRPPDQQSSSNTDGLIPLFWDQFLFEIALLFKYYILHFFTWNTF